jgi:hypothetical protein
MNLTQQTFESTISEGDNSLVAVRVPIDRVLRQLEGNPLCLLRFLRWYADWNAAFAGGVASLSGLIAQQRDRFREPGYPTGLADRSNYIASYIFDAARDEFDDHIDPLRDTHRCLAQATLKGIAHCYNMPLEIFDEPVPRWLTKKLAQVRHGYLGQRTHIFHGSIEAVFYGIGFHLGSELLADQEFTIIDEYIREKHPTLFKYLTHNTEIISGNKHRAYAWIAIHSHHGQDSGGVEEDHFNSAVAGANDAFRFLYDQKLYNECYTALMEGFKDFASDQKEFFTLAGQMFGVLEQPIHLTKHELG